MYKHFLLTGIALGTALLTACASGYKQFYKAVDGVTPETIAKSRVAPAPTVPMVERIAPASGDSILDAYSKRGYTLIGHSFFNSGRAESEEAAIQQGQAVGADLVVIINPQYTGSVTSVVPITVPTTTTSYSTGTATAYGTKGTVTAFGSGTTTTYGTNTTFIPKTIHRVDYGAGYFIKQKFILGAYFRDLDDSERRAFQTNKGLIVRLVVNDSPAFSADLLPGDMITAIDSQAIENANALGLLLDANRGRKVVLTVTRSGRTLELPVQLNP